MTEPERLKIVLMIESLIEDQLGVSDMIRGLHAVEDSLL